MAPPELEFPTSIRPSGHGHSAPMVPGPRSTPNPGLGYRRGMRRIERTLRMAAPAAAIYAFLADPANLPTWQSGVVSAERTSPPPTAAGSTARVVVGMMGQRIAADLRVVEAVPDRRLVLATSVSGMSVVASLDLADAPDAPGSTDVSLASEIKAENLFMAPLEGMVADGAARDLDASLARLEAALGG